jgi:3-hydroxyacyl-CoA dehydrogenase / enoyl-CoA hydratase / 3-hydroxybutyryl-CoA epimerase
VVRGAGRHFSSGADLEELGRRLAVEPDLQVSRFLADNIRTFQSLATLPLATVAAVGGCCLGSGLELALACHRRLATENAVLALPEAQYGLMPGCGGTVRLARLLGRSQALRLIMSGRSLMASEALELGLVEAVLPRRELVPAAEALAGGRR